MSFAFSITLFSSVDNDTPVISLNRIIASPTEDAKSDYKRTHQLYKKMIVTMKLCAVMGGTQT